jgi:hypothetical protein
MLTNSLAVLWLPRLGALGGFALVSFGLFLSSDTVIGTLAGQAPEHLDQLWLGALLFKGGLVFHGLILAWVTAAWPKWTMAHGSGAQTALWTPAVPRDTATGDRGGVLFVVGLLALGAALRVIHLGSGLWYDEVTTLVDFVRHPLGQILTSFPTDNQHTLFSILAHGSVALFGESHWALRLPAVLFGVAGIWALYALARTIASKHEALLAAALLTVSYHHIWFSQNARGYTGLLFFTLLGTWLFVRGLHEVRPALWLGYAIVMTLGVFTHLTMVFVFASHVLAYGWLLVGRWRRGDRLPEPYWIPLLSFVLVGSLSFQLYSLVVPQVINAAVDETTVPSDWTNPIWMLAEAARGMKVGFAGGVGGLAAAVLFGSGLASYARENRLIVALLVLPGLLGTFVIVLLQHNFWPRFFFYTLGFLVLIALRGAMMIGEGLARLVQRGPVTAIPPRWVGMAVACSLILVSVASLPAAYRYPKQDFEGALAYVEQHQQPGEALIAVGLASVPYQRYYAPQLKSVETVGELNAVRARSEGTWLLYTFPIHMQAHFPGILASIRSKFRVVKVFPGTVGDGAIYVCRSVDVT